MGFFNFSKSTDNSGEQGGSPSSNDSNSTEVSQQQQPQRQPVVIMLNHESVTVSADDAEGKTVRELFEEYGEDLGDVDRINRFVAAGSIVDPASTVQLGIVYRGAVTSESKGL